VRKTCLLWALGLILGLGWNYSVSYAAGKQLELQAILSKEIPVMLQFGKSYCPRCKAKKPALDSAAKAYAGQAQIVSVDSDVNMPLVRNFKIRLIPTQIFLLPKGREFYRHEGFLQAHNISDIFSKMGLPKVEINSVESRDAAPRNRLPAVTGTRSQR
jgi:thioredoxin-like negative regulator of GroEL